jgi:uncharacterized protein
MLLAAGQSPAPAPPSGDNAALPAVMVAASQGFISGNYLEVVKGNVVFTIANVVRRLLLMFFPRVVGMFLLGFWAGRNNVFARLDEYRGLVRRALLAGISLGLPLVLIGWWWGDHAVGPPNVAGLIETAIKSFGVPLLALGYTAGLWLLFARSPALMAVLAPVGRMALSNYLMHSVVGVIVFYGLGFGLFGTLSLTGAVVSATVLFAVQVVVSRWWLERARFGPAEWLWRMFTYGRRFSLWRGQTY